MHASHPRIHRGPSGIQEHDLVRRLMARRPILPVDALVRSPGSRLPAEEDVAQAFPPNASSRSRVCSFLCAFPEPVAGLAEAGRLT